MKYKRFCLSITPAIEVEALASTDYCELKEDNKECKI